MKKLSKTKSNFIRCINPNIHAKPNCVDSPSVMTQVCRSLLRLSLDFSLTAVPQQLRCSGMLEALHIMQAGFPTRCYFNDLYNKYKSYMPVEIARLKPSLFCEALLVALDLEGGKDFQV